MPITFTVNQDAGYFMASYEGSITEALIMEAHRIFFESGEWNPRLNALVDLSEANLLENSNEAIRRIAQFFERILISNHANGLKTAIFAPSDFPYGVARVYEAMTTFSPYAVKVFRDMGEAREWLKEPLDNGQ